MSYRRVLPRDLFNEASLLKCYGKLWLLLDAMPVDSHGAMFMQEDVSTFDVQQDEASGELFVDNLDLLIFDRVVRLSRPLNSRAPWPLYASFDDNCYLVFDEEGALSEEFLNLIRMDLN